MNHRHLCLTLILALSTVLYGVTPVAAQTGSGTQRDPKEEQAILDQLAQINPQAVPIFQEATRALDSGDYVAARQGYEKVLELAPGFSPAERRLSYVETRLGNVEAAIQHARAAVAAEPSSYNESALALALLSATDVASRREGLKYARSAVEKLPDDAQANSALLLGGLYNNDVSAIRQASAKLVVVVPNEPIGHYFNGLVAADDGQWEKAEQELLLSQQLGMGAAEVQKALNDLNISQQANQARWLRAGAYATVTWIISGVLLFAVGILLSRVTMNAVRHHERTIEYRVSRAESTVRTLYRMIIGLTSAYFYVSIPFLILIVVAATLGIFYLFLAIGRIPIQLAVALGLGAIYTLIAIVRSVFTRVSDPEPGKALAREEAPQLWALTAAVAQRVDTRAVDAIYITPGTSIAVTERGGMLKKLRGAGQRCLILGLGVLPGMTQSQFEAVLAHEYGHFSNRDTAGGNVARQVQISIRHMAYRLATSGQATWYNPAWWFVNGFYRLFLRITLGATRLQEILADRYAALAYGARNFVEGLTHVMRQDLIFDWQVGREARQAQQSRSDLRNLYTLPAPDSAEVQRQIEQKLAEVINRPTSPYDSHPSVKDRIELVQQISAVDSSGTNQNLIGDLLPNIEALQHEMTKTVQKNVQQRQAST